MLALTIVAESEVSEPDFLEGLKVVSADGKHFLMHDPINDICARRVGQGALVVIEGINFEGRGLHNFLSLVGELFFDTSDLGRGQSVEELREADLLNQTEVKRAQLLNEGVAVIGDLEQNANDSKGLFVFFPAWGPVDQFMHNMNFQIILLAIEAMLARAMHVKMIHIVVEGSLAI